MIPRLNISFSLARQIQYWWGREYLPTDGEYLLNHARSGIIMALRTCLPNGGKVGVVAYNCHTVANAVVNANCTLEFVDVTDNLLINVPKLNRDLDAIVVTNLFGIRNDIEAIRTQCPHAIIIVDNAHGYGLPSEGDFTVYSINQGKFPSLGEGGILQVNRERLDVKETLDDMYTKLPTYSIVAQIKLFIQMQLKAILYSQCLYWLTMKMKKMSKPRTHQKEMMQKMAPGIRSMYNAALPDINKYLQIQRENAQHIAERLQTNENVENVLWGENAFMAIARSKNPKFLQEEFRQQGIETATHFVHAIDWAKSFGYKEGTCPNTEFLTTHLIMIPTYCKLI